MSDADRAAQLTANATKWMAIFTFFLALTSLGTIWILRNQLSEMHSGGIDTHNLADAADKTRAAAEKSAQASRDFADTAGEINSSIGTAVEKLNLQAGALKQSVDQAARLAKATEEANASVLAADRPWVGGVIVITDFEVGKTPKANCLLTNSGRRPAIVEQLRMTGGNYPAFPAKPGYGKVGLNSRSLILPNGNVQCGPNGGMILFSVPSEPLYLQEGVRPTAELMRALDAGETKEFVYAEIDYLDARTGEKHVTHLCVVFTPDTPEGPKGFYNCPTYNDAN